MRGIANTQLFGPAGVQLYVDGIPQADISSYSSTLYDIESIEILRGPQGHKFGKSVTGGAINIKTKAPSDQQINRITASYGTFETQEYNINSIEGQLVEEIKRLCKDESYSDKIANIIIWIAKESMMRDGVIADSQINEKMTKLGKLRSGVTE